LLYREGVALANGRLQKPDEASRRFQAILDLNIGEDEPGAVLAEQQKKAASQRTAVANAAGKGGTVRPVTGRAALQNARYQIQQAVGLDNRYDPFGLSSGRQMLWTPP